MTRRIELFGDFVRAQLPPPPVRVLEIGCGNGELAQALASQGYEITAIDPDAPPGSIFHRVSLEDFTDPHGFAGVVSSVALHHTADLAGALDKIVDFLPAGGVLVLEEFARENLSGATARWYYHQRRSLAEAGRVDAVVAEDFARWEQDSRTDLADIHPVATIRAQLESRFAERIVQWTPYLYSFRLDDALEPLERRLISEGAIDATGLWYVGARL